MQVAHFSHVWNKPGMTPAERYAQLWRELKLCDELGFDYGFAVEHHFSPHESWMPAPTVYTTGAALCTRRMRIGPMGYVVPLYDPLRIVEEAAVLDQVCQGRFELGLVSGITPAYFEPYQADFTNRRALTEESVRILKTALAAGSQSFSFAGAHHQYKEVRLSVPPAQRPFPPMWVPSRDADTLAFLAAEGIDTGSLLFVPREEVAPRYQAYARAWSEAGHRRAPRIGYWAPVYVDESDSVAIERATPHIQMVFGAMGGFGDVGGLSVSALAANFRRRGEHGAAEIADHLLDVDYLLRRNLVFVGSPETVTRQIQLASTEGFFNVVECEFNLGGLDEESVSRSIRLFGHHVLPSLHAFEPLTALT
jgi:alkanesulfonate monooxygenase SsuD/methylene tetrahydromethanopterin reductase-like flavin-dependent oxidoreductase (luciferase family)